MRRMLRSASAILHVSGWFGEASCACVLRYLSKNGFNGPILASITALTRLVTLYGPPPPCVAAAELAVRTAR